MVQTIAHPAFFLIYCEVSDKLRSSLIRLESTSTNSKGTAYLLDRFNITTIYPFLHIMTAVPGCHHQPFIPRVVLAGYIFFIKFWIFKRRTMTEKMFSGFLFSPCYCSFCRNHFVVLAVLGRVHTPKPVCYCNCCNLGLDMTLQVCLYLRRSILLCLALC